jgi:hypothetical protein
MKNYDYERDEVIRQGKKKTKPKATKSDHKHDYVRKFIPRDVKDKLSFSVDRTEEQCSICGKVGKVIYHWKLNRE